MDGYGGVCGHLFPEAPSEQPAVAFKASHSAREVNAGVARFASKKALHPSVCHKNKVRATLILVPLFLSTPSVSHKELNFFGSIKLGKGDSNVLMLFQAFTR
jgi:hypothetical protein